MRIWLTLIIGLLFWAALVTWTVWTTAPSIEADLKEKSTDALQAIGQTDLNVLVRARDVSVSGDLHNDASRERVVEAVDSIWGVKRVLLNDASLQTHSTESDTNDELASTEIIAAAEQCETPIPDSQSIYFDSKASITDDLTMLDTPISFAKNCVSATVTIIGHADSRSNDAFNDQLALDRAYFIANLFSHSGIEPTRIKVISHGEQNPIGNNQTETGRRQNRRVDVTIEVNPS